TRVWVAAMTFAIGVVLTMVWVVPFDRREKTPDEGAASNLSQKRELEHRDGWRRLEFNKKVFIKLPPDMRSEEQLIGDSLRYVEAYSNNQLGLTIVGDLLVPVPDSELQKKRAFPCDPPEIIRKNPTYRESLIQVDGRQAKLWITRSAERGIYARVCFPNADDSLAALEIIASCKDDQGLATAREIFNSIEFKR
ncbi:MAG TPA: hypothetical protein VF435_05590, partial [Pyrinomonadaceae bacterium]